MNKLYISIIVLVIALGGLFFYQNVSRTSGPVDQNTNTQQASSSDMVATSSSTVLDTTYSINGITFQYATKFNSAYASLKVEVTVRDVNASTTDMNTCLKQDDTLGQLKNSDKITVNRIPYCRFVFEDVGAGQLYTTYRYETVHGERLYTIDYIVHTANGCGAYQNSSEVSDSGNEKYRECLNLQDTYSDTVLKPIQISIESVVFGK